MRSKFNLKIINFMLCIPSLQKKKKRIKNKNIRGGNLNLGNEYFRILLKFIRFTLILNAKINSLLGTVSRK